jgi:hypothetical protein
LRVGIDGERSQARAERLVLGMAEVLVFQEQHLVVVERLLEVLEALVGKLGQANARDFRADRRSERARFEVRAFEGMIVEFPARGDADFPHLLLLLSSAVMPGLGWEGKGARRPSSKLR